MNYKGSKIGLPLFSIAIICGVTILVINGISKHVGGEVIWFVLIALLAGFALGKNWSNEK